MSQLRAYQNEYNALKEELNQKKEKLNGTVDGRL
jgi:hypothetical protein